MGSVAADPNPLDDPADAAALRRHADALLGAVEAAVAGWVERSVADRYWAWSGDPPPAEVVAAAAEAGARVRAEVVPALRDLLATDVDEQRDNPLAVLRRAVTHATDVLRVAGVPEVDRDDHARRLFPEDAYDLAVASFGEVHSSVHDPGIVWGAAKAHVVLARRRHEGRR